MKFPVNFGMRGHSGPAAQTGLNRFIRIIGVLALACLLPACSALKIFYNQAPDVAYWYLDGYIDFTGAQSLQVKDDLGKLQVWHRQTQLPAYIDTLRKLRQRMPADMDAAQVCAVFADVRSKLVAVSHRAEPVAVALVGTLQTSQLTQLERQWAKGNADYREAFLEGSPKKGRDKRYKQAVSRAERLYGTLEEKQLAVIGQRMDQSRFDAALFYAEKLRRQQDVLQTLRALVAERASVEKTRLAVRGLLERWLHSPIPAHRDHLEGLTQESCQTFAALHNSTTPAQRNKALETLDAYEQDLRTLSSPQGAQKS